MKSHETIAVVPVYESMVGNVCRLYGLQGETELSNISIGAQMSRFYRERGLDEAHRLRWIRSLLGRKKNVPVALDSSCLFIPVKVRIPMSKNDGAYAYIRLSAVSAVRDQVVVFLTGETLDCLQSERSILSVLQQGKMLAAWLEERESRERLESKISELMLRGHRSKERTGGEFVAEDEALYRTNKL